MAKEMKIKKLLSFLLFLFVFVCVGEAQEPLPDTVWTKDLWQLGSTIYQVQFTPDQQNIAVAIGGGVYIFDKNTSEQVKQFKKDKYACRYFTFSEDGTKLIGVYDDDKIIVWNYLTTDTIHIYNDIYLYEIKPYDNNSIIGVEVWFNLQQGKADSSKISIFDFNSGQIIRSQSKSNLNEGFRNQAFSIQKEHNLVAITTYIKDDFNKNVFIELWDLISLTKIASLGSHTSPVNDLAISPNGKYLASADDKGNIKVWDIKTQSLLKFFNFDSNLTEPTIWNIKFTTKGGFLVVGGGTFSKFATKIFNIPSAELIHSYYYEASGGLDINADSSLIAIGRSRSLILNHSKWISTDFQEPMSETLLSIYPNPSMNEITLQLDFGLIPQEIDISDINGISVKVISDIQPIKDSMKINISALSIGTYYVSIVYPQKIVHYKFEKVR